MLFTYRLYEPVVIGIFKTGLQSVVIDICDRTLCFDAVNTHCFKFKICHGAGSVLSERLIDLKTHVGAGYHLPVNQMSLDYLLCDSKSQRDQLLENIYFIILQNRPIVNDLTQ